MIRAATTADRLRVIELLRDSHAGAGFDRADGPTGFHFEFEEAYAERLLLTHLLNASAFAIVHVAKDDVVQGILMATSFEHPYARVRLAKESVWWIDPAHRGRAGFQMLDAYNAWWVKIGCAFGGMAGMGDDPIISNLLRRRGYRVAETHFLKAAP